MGDNLAIIGGSKRGLINTIKVIKSQKDMIKHFGKPQSNSEIQKRWEEILAQTKGAVPSAARVATDLLRNGIAIPKADKRRLNKIIAEAKRKGWVQVHDGR